MKPTLIVEGKTYPVRDMTLSDKGIESVTIFKDGIYTTFYDINSNIDYFIEKPLQIDFATSLNLNIVREEKLIEHLDQMLKAEDDDLIGMAIDIAEMEYEEPFALNLLEKRKERNLHKQRVFGMIDAVEEVKAFLEGYYDKGDSDV